MHSLPGREPPRRPRPHPAALRRALSRPNSGMTVEIRSARGQAARMPRGKLPGNRSHSRSTGKVRRKPTVASDASLPPNLQGGAPRIRGCPFGRARGDSWRSAAARQAPRPRGARRFPRRPGTDRYMRLPREARRPVHIPRSCALVLLAHSTVIHAAGTIAMGGGGGGLGEPGTGAVIFQGPGAVPGSPSHNK